MKIDLHDPKNWNNPTTGERYHYFRRDGRGYDDVMEWAREYEPPKNKDEYKEWFKKTKVVKQQYVLGGTVWISTVWLGLDHSFMPTTRPLIFETMVFPRFWHARGWSELDVDRWTTEEEALAGHKAMVKKWSNPLHIVRYFLEEWQWRLSLSFDRLKRRLLPF